MDRSIRITGIALAHNGERFEEGAIIVVHGETPDDLVERLQARLDAGTAEEAFGEDALPAELVAAIAAFADLADQQHQQLVVLIGLGIEGGPASAAAIMAVFQDLQMRSMDLAPGVEQLGELASQFERLAPAGVADVETQQDGPDAHDQRSGSSGSGPSGDAGSEASAGGGPTGAEVSAAKAAPTPSPAEKPAETKAARPRGSRSKTS